MKFARGREQLNTKEVAEFKNGGRRLREREKNERSYHPPSHYTSVKLQSGDEGIIKLN